MAVDPARHRRMQQRLIAVLGAEEAETLVEQLARGRPATKDDLEDVERRLGHRMDGVENRMDGLENRMDRVETRLDGLGRYVEELRDMLVERIDARAEALAGRIAGAEGGLETTLHRELGAVRTDLAAQTRTFVLAQLGMLITLAALAFAALRIT